MQKAGFNISISEGEAEAAYRAICIFKSTFDWTSIEGIEWKQLESFRNTLRAVVAASKGVALCQQD